MATETERKFLVDRTLLELDPKEGVRIFQGYPVENETHILRVRLAGKSAWITIKSKEQTPGKEGWVSREEIEFELPSYKTGGLLSGCKKVLSKTRYRVEYSGYNWDVDIIPLPDGTLYMAEIELPPEDPDIPIPPWCTIEVTNDPYYYNSSLAGKQHPPKD